MAVSDLFLTSHAYLKDSAIQIKACSQVSRIQISTSNDSADFRTAKTAVNTALQYASLSPQDIQIVSIAAGTKTTRQTELSELGHAHSPERLQSLGQVTGSSGLTSLCGIGKEETPPCSLRLSVDSFRTVWQLRGWVSSVSSTQIQHCLQDTIHDDGTNTVFVLSRSDGKEAPKWTTVKDLRDGRERLGYNPASETRQVSQEDVEAVRADKAFTGGDDIKKLELPVKGGDRAALARL